MVAYLVHWDACWMGLVCCFFFFFFFLLLFYFFYCSGFCHTLTWLSLGYTCIPHPDPPSHLPLHPIPPGLPSAPGPSTCLMHPTWAGDLVCCFVCGLRGLWDPRRNTCVGCCRCWVGSLEDPGKQACKIAGGRTGGRGGEPVFCG